MQFLSSLGQIQSDAVGITFLVFYLGCLLVGVLPTIIAFARGHPNRWVILGINFFLGATGIGWFVAMIWALNLFKVEPKKPDNINEQ